VGQIPNDVNIKDISGMSGGPICGFRRDDEGRWRFYIVALQSRWRRDSRITFGCHLAPFAENLFTGALERLEAGGTGDKE